MPDLHDIPYRLQVINRYVLRTAARSGAISAGRSSLEAFLKDEVKKKGGVNIYTSTKIKTVMATEGGYGDWEDEATARTVNYVEILSRAIGDPPEMI